MFEKMTKNEKEARGGPSFLKKPLLGINLIAMMLVNAYYSLTN